MKLIIELSKKTKEIFYEWRRYIMNFGMAIEALKDRKKVAREGWNGKGMWLAVMFPWKHSEMDGLYVYIKTTTGKFYPWNASQQDLFADDWVVID